MAAVCGEAGSFAVYAMPSPPLQHDADALTKVIGCAERQIPLVFAPAPNAGTTSPRSITAAVLVNNAEVLSGLVLHQHVRPGAPFIYGAGGGAMDMRAMTADPYSIPEALPRSAGLLRARPLLRPAELLLRRRRRVQGPRRAVVGRGAPSPASPGRCRGATLLHDVGYLECGMQSSLRVDRPRRRAGRLGARLHARRAGRRVVARPRRDRKAGPGRSPPGLALHPAALPRVLVGRTVRPRLVRRLGRGWREDAPRQGPRAGTGARRRGAPVHADRRTGRPARGAPRRRAGARRRAALTTTARHPPDGAQRPEPSVRPAGVPRTNRIRPSGRPAPARVPPHAARRTRSRRRRPSRRRPG